jgi:hypothetical protein
LIASAQASDELRHILVAFQSAETLHGFENGGSGPSQDHVSAAPPFDVPLHVPRAADQAFDRIGRRDRLPEAIGQAEREDGEGVVEAFTDARRGTWIPVLESTRQIVQETTSGGDLDVPVGARDDRADPGPLAFREMLQDVSQLVDLMPTSA